MGLVDFCGDFEVTCSFDENWTCWVEVLFVDSRVPHLFICFPGCFGPLSNQVQ